jgi:hypothetical protein
VLLSPAALRRNGMVHTPVCAAGFGLESGLDGQRVSWRKWSRLRSRLQPRESALLIFGSVESGGLGRWLFAVEPCLVLTSGLLRPICREGAPVAASSAAGERVARLPGGVSSSSRAVLEHFGARDDAAHVFVRARARGNGKRATAAVMRCGCCRGKFFEGYESCRGEGLVVHTWFARGGARCRKRGKPHGRHGLQHTRERQLEEAVEVVRNHEGGT